MKNIVLFKKKNDVLIYELYDIPALHALNFWTSLHAHGQNNRTYNYIIT